MRQRSRLGLSLFGVVGVLLASAAPAPAATHFLDPNANLLSDWTEVPAGYGYDRLNDGLDISPIRQPTAPNTATDYITRTSATGAASAVGVTDYNLAPGETPVYARAWFYVQGGGTAVRLGWSGLTRANTTVAASSPAQWRTIGAPIQTQAQVNDIHLGFQKESGTGAAYVYAAYVELTTAGGPVDLPNPPQSYTIPGGAVSVDTGAELATELASSTPHDIVLENTATPYTTPGNSPFMTSTGHRLWARSLGGAVLNAGLVFGGVSGVGGGEVHGLVFEVTDPAKALIPGSPDTDSAMLTTWGDAGANTKVYDTTFAGDPGVDHKIHAGILMRQPQGAVIQRVKVSDVKRFGVYLQVTGGPNDPIPYDHPEKATTIEDVDVDGVAFPTPGSDQGRSEAGLWVGAPVANPVQRLRLEHAGWMGLWTGGSSKDTTFRDITISTVDRPDGGVGIYPEHRSVRNTYEQFNIGPNIYTGINCEWYDYNPIGACEGSKFQDGTIDSSAIGVYLGERSKDNRIQRIVFKNQECVGISNHEGINNTYIDNNFADLISRGVPTVQTTAIDPCA